LYQIIINKKYCSRKIS